MIEVNGNLLRNILSIFEFMSRLGEIVTDGLAQTVWLKTTWRFGGVMSVPKSVS